MSAEQSLASIARELRLIREALERESPPPAKDEKPAKKQRAVFVL